MRIWKNDQRLDRSVSGMSTKYINMREQQERQNGIDNIYIWPDGETPKRIYEERYYTIINVLSICYGMFFGYDT